MKNMIFILFLFPLLLFSQTDRKETVYLLFDTNSEDKCVIEDGSGNFLKIKKFQKKENKRFIEFHICNEKFVFNEVKNKKDTCTVKFIDNIKNIKYLLENYEKSNEFKHHVFKKIFIVEIISKNKIIKYEVFWNDKRLGIVE